MPVYEAIDTPVGSGHSVGILLLTKTNPFIPGDVANASTYDFPVVYKTVPGASSDRVLPGDPDLEPAVVETAKELEALGVKGISSDCGFFLNYQEPVRNAVNVPVFMSSLLQLPMVSAALGKDKAIGIVTANSRRLGNRILGLSRVDPERKIVAKGLQDMPEWQTCVGKAGPYLDFETIREEVVTLAKELKDENPDVGAIVLECSLLPPYANAVQEATGLPVFDFMTVIDYFEAGLHRSDPERRH
jgi:hypothetical protein